MARAARSRLHTRPPVSVHRWGCAHAEVLRTGGGTHTPSCACMQHLHPLAHAQRWTHTCARVHRVQTAGMCTDNPAHTHLCTLVHRSTHASIWVNRHTPRMHSAHLYAEHKHGTCMHGMFNHQPTLPMASLGTKVPAPPSTAVGRGQSPRVGAPGGPRGGNGRTWGASGQHLPAGQRGLSISCSPHTTGGPDRAYTCTPGHR